MLPTPGSIPSSIENGSTGKRDREAEQDALTLTLSQTERGPVWTASNTKKLLLSTWLGGIAILALRLSIGYCRIWRTVRRAKHAANHLLPVRPRGQNHWLPRFGRIAPVGRRAIAVSLRAAPPAAALAGADV